MHISSAYLTEFDGMRFVVAKNQTFIICPLIAQLMHWQHCHAIVKVKNAALNFALSVSADFREPFCAHLQCSLIILPVTLQNDQ